MIESSNKTIGYCQFNADYLNVFVGCAEGNPFLGVDLSEEEKCLAGKDKDEVLQQKEIENSLSSDESNTNEDEAVMLPMMKPDINEDKEELTCLHGQENMVGQTYRTVTMMRDQNFILKKDDEAVS